MNTSNAVEGRPRSKSVGEAEVDSEFAAMLASRRVDAFEDFEATGRAGAGAAVSEPVKIVYEESPDILDSLFRNIVDILINILPPGAAIMGGTAHVLMSRRFGIERNFLTNILKRKGGYEEQYAFKRDIDVILTNSMRFSDVRYHLEQIGQIEIVKTARTYHGQTHHNLRQMRQLTSIKLKIPLRADAIRGMTSGALSFFTPFFSKELFEKFPSQFIVDMDFVEVAVSDVSQLADHWFVTNELRIYALMIKQKRSDMFTSQSGRSERDLIPVQTSSILPPTLTNLRGEIVTPLNTLFDYVKGLSWETSPLPGRTRSGMTIPLTTTEPLRITSELDMIVRLANIHSDHAVVHVATPDFWIPHIVYDDSVTVEQIRETFHFGKLLSGVSDAEREEFRSSAAKRVFNHIHDECGSCCICMSSLNEPGTSFVALPCGCTSVMHLECFLKNYLSPAILQVMNSLSNNPDPKHVECPLCRKAWWTVKRPRSKLKFRALKNEYSMYYPVDELLQGSIFQLYNTKLYEQLTSNPKSTDFWDFVE